MTKADPARSVTLAQTNIWGGVPEIWSYERQASRLNPIWHKFIRYIIDTLEYETFTQSLYVLRNLFPQEGNGWPDEYQSYASDRWVAIRTAAPDSYRTVDGCLHRSVCDRGGCSVILWSVSSQIAYVEPWIHWGWEALEYNSVYMARTDERMVVLSSASLSGFCILFSLETNRHRPHDYTSNRRLRSS